MGHRHGAKAPSGAYAEAATGGLAASQYLSDVCVWDQASGGWRPSVHMQTGRSRFAATVLQGRVYAVGGICAEGPTASVESWAPGESSWRLEPDLPGARYGHRLCQLQGRLYLRHRALFMGRHDCFQRVDHVRLGEEAHRCQREHDHDFVFGYR